MKRPVTTVSQYIAAQPKPARAALRRVRSAIRTALPRAAETIAYGIPTIKIDGRSVLSFAGWKQHYSFYPAGARLVAAFSRELAAYEFNSKGTLRFPLAKPVPVRLIGALARFRAREAAERDRARHARKRARARP
jgi:uncharacterized protein YdhG (YjbR/CyaY superfamily)